MLEPCPHCGEDLFSIDFLGDELEWAPCCMDGRGLVEIEWGAMDHRTRKDLVASRLGFEPHEVAPTPAGWFMVRPLEIRTISRPEARAFVDREHRHHGAPVGDMYRFGAYRDGELVAVAVAGRPVARMLDRLRTMIEVTRLATVGGLRARHAATSLYAACAREAKSRGYQKVITYTLESESGVSLRAAGFVPVYRSRGGTWSRGIRPRTDSAPTCPKIRWERVIHNPSPGTKTNLLSIPASVDCPVSSGRQGVGSRRDIGATP